MPFDRRIVHLDADAFFASVEQAADARLRGKAIAVGGEKRGIIASASYEARKFGIYTPMPTVMARRLCPKLILLPGDFEKYELFSRLMFSYAYDFTPDVEIGSIDEGYFDLTGVRNPAVGIAETIRHAIRQALKRADLTLEQMDRIEVNEAFSAQYLAVEKELGLNRDKTNVNGGAISLGHPLAATGARITISLIYELRRHHLKYGIGSACIGGGQGIAVVIENVA